ncbi:unnamed protein product, partial [Brenthis ino]
MKSRIAYSPVIVATRRRKYRISFVKTNRQLNFASPIMSIGIQCPGLFHRHNAGQDAQGLNPGQAKRILSKSVRIQFTK